jgi:hypothetical protein
MPVPRNLPLTATQPFKIALGVAATQMHAVIGAGVNPNVANAAFLKISSYTSVYTTRQNMNAITTGLKIRADDYVVDAIEMLPLPA